MVKNQCFEDLSPVKFVLMQLENTSIKKRTFVPIFVIVLLTITSCKSGNFFGKDHGTILFDITYPYNQGDIKTILYPAELEVIFDETHERSHMSTAFGVVENDYIIDHENKNVVQLLNYMGTRYELDINPNNQAEWLALFPPMTIEPTDETNTLAGYECKKAIAHFPNDSLPAVEIFYTNDIEVGEGNWWNIYHDIDGVILGYDLVQYGQRMRFRASKVEFKEIEPSEFNYDKGEKNVDVSTMKSFLDEIAKTYL